MLLAALVGLCGRPAAAVCGAADAASVTANVADVHACGRRRAAPLASTCHRCCGHRVLQSQRLAVGASARQLRLQHVLRPARDECAQLARHRREQRGEGSAPRVGGRDDLGARRCCGQRSV